MEDSSSSREVEPSAEQRLDDQMFVDVRLVLDARSYYGIRVTVRACAVTLEGMVDSWTERRLIGLRVHEVPDVLRVINLLEVRAPPAVTALRSSIEDALARRAVREARRIDFEIVNGMVAVAGVVGSEGDRDAVLGAVIATTGVIGVDDQLRIAPFRRRSR